MVKANRGCRQPPEVQSEFECVEKKQPKNYNDGWLQPGTCISLQQRHPLPNITAVPFSLLVFSQEPQIQKLKGKKTPAVNLEFAARSINGSINFQIQVSILPSREQNSWWGLCHRSRDEIVPCQWQILETVLFMWNGNKYLLSINDYSRQSLLK